MSRQLSTTVFIALPHPIESYIVAAMHPIDMHPRTRRFRARAIIAFVSLQIVRRRALPMRAKPRRCRHRSCMVRCSSAYRPKDSSPTARRSPMRSRNPRPKKSCAIRSAARSRRIFRSGISSPSNFVIPGAVRDDFKTAPREEIRAHIDRLWAALTRTPEILTRRDSQLRSRPAMSCRAGAFARCTTGIPTSRWWDCRRAGVTISWPTWSKTLPVSSIGTDTFPMAAAAIT